MDLEKNRLKPMDHIEKNRLFFDHDEFNIVFKNEFKARLFI